MRILQINSVCGFGSTGRTVEELAIFLQQNSHESFVAYGHGKTTYSQSFKYGNWLEKKAHALQTRISGRQGLGSLQGTKELINYIKITNPDIVHIRNLHGNHINFPVLFNFLAKNNYPIVWTLHDCWAFTGICYHYTAASCYKWRTQCNAYCPHFHAFLPEIGNDRVKEMFELKKKHFTSIEKMIVVPVSKWLENEAKQSFLAKYHIQHIYNWVDLNKFKPDPEDIRIRYGIPQEKEIVLGVSAVWSETSSKYVDAINLYYKLSDDFCLVMVGALQSGTTFPERIVHIPYVHNVNDLSKIYSSAMVYVHFSVEDTFGKVIVEALACGTPAIVFDSTAIPELILDRCGYVVTSHNINEVLSCILLIQAKTKAYYSKDCINNVTTNFNSENNMRKYIQAYNKLLSNGY